MDTATKVVDLAERLLGKFTLRVMSVAIVLTVVNVIGKRLSD